MSLSDAFRLIAMLRGADEGVDMPALPPSPRDAVPHMSAGRPSGPTPGASIGAPRGPQGLRHNHPEATIGARTPNGAGAGSRIGAPPNSLRGSGFGGALTRYEKANLNMPEMGSGPMAGLAASTMLPNIEAPVDAEPSVRRGSQMVLKSPTMFSEPEGELPTLPKSFTDMQDAGIGEDEMNDTQDMSGFLENEPEEEDLHAGLHPDFAEDNGITMNVEEILGGPVQNTKFPGSPFSKLAAQSAFRLGEGDSDSGLVEGGDVGSDFHSAFGGPGGMSRRKPPVEPTGAFAGNAQGSVIPQLPGQLDEVYAGERPDEALGEGPEIGRGIPTMTGGRQFKTPKDNLFKALMHKMF